MLFNEKYLSITKNTRIKTLFDSPQDCLGNKHFKLKLNIKRATEHKNSKLLTFGGAFSNHIQATAIVGKQCNFETIGIIRGDELSLDINKTLAQNPTLKSAHENGMTFKFVNRSDYRKKSQADFIKNLQEEFPNCYIIPEGGTNELAVKGCEDILAECDSAYDYICCPVGTGGTISGIINASANHQTVLGFSALKGDFLSAEIKKYTNKVNWQLISDYHFGGYAKINSELIQFINTYKIKHGVQLDPIYTAKMMYGLSHMQAIGYFPKNSRILAIHTGGLQGIAGMNLKLKEKGLPLIDVSL